MQRKRTLMIAALTVTAALAGFVVAGSAFGADWQEYDGSLQAGTAHVIPVPEGADVLAFKLQPGENATAPHAAFTLLDPSDARVGNFELDAEADSVEIENPEAGEYVVFTYELAEADVALQLYGPSADDLSLARADVTREDRALVRDHDGSELAKEMTVNVTREPVFLTLIYEGRVENLNAELATANGPVLVITGESGTAFAPGLTVGAEGARKLDLMNLAAGDLDVNLNADAFQGTMYLTELHVERPSEVDPEDPEDADGDVEAPAAYATAESRTPTAVEVTDGALVLGRPSAFEVKEENETEREWHDWGWEDYRDYGHTVVSVYDPADTLIGVYEVDHETPIMVLEDLENGEYVLYATGSRSRGADGVLAIAYPDAEAAPDLRTLETVDGSFVLGSYNEVARMEESFTFTFEKPPLALAFDLSNADVVTDFHGYAESPEGEVIHAYSFVSAGESGFWMGYSEAERAHLVAGEYAFHAEAFVYSGDLGLKWTTYDRSLEVEEPEEEAADEEEAQDEEDEAPEDGARSDATNGLAAVVSVVSDVLGL